MNNYKSLQTAGWPFQTPHRNRPFPNPGVLI